MYIAKQEPFSVLSNGFVDIPDSERAQFNLELDTKNFGVKIHAPGSKFHEITGTFDLTNGGDTAEVRLLVSSPLVPSNQLALNAVVHKSSKAAGFNVDASLYGMNNAIKAEVEIFPEQFTAFVEMKVPQYNVNGEVLKVSGKQVDGLEGDLQLHAFGKHRAQMAIYGWEKGDVSIRSTALEADTFALSYSMTNFNHDANYISKGEASLKAVIGEGEYAMAVQTNIPSYEDMEASVCLSSPWDSIKSAEAKAKLRTKEGFMLDVDFKSSSDLIPAAGLTAKVQVEPEVVDASFRLVTPVQEFENVGLLINVPRQPSKGAMRFEPRLSFTMPNSQYTIKGTVRNTDDKTTLELEATWPENNFKVSLYLKKLSPFSLRAEITTPFENFEKISFNGELNLGFPQDGRAYASLKINNERTYEGTLALKIQPGIYKMVVDVSTPLEKHNYGVTLRFEKTSRKTIHVEFEYPGSTIGLEFDYVFSGYDNMVARASVKTPYSGYEELTMSFVNQILEAGYHGEIGGTVGRKSVLLSVYGTMKEGELVEGNLKMNALEHSFQLAGFGKTSGNHLSAQLEILSSWDQLKQVRIAYSQADDSSTNGQVVNSATAEYNSKVVFSFSKVGDEKSNEVQVVTPWRTVYAKNMFDWGTDKNILHTEVCWDMGKRKESTLAVSVKTERTTFGQLAIAEVVMPQRAVTLHGSYSITTLKFEHNLECMWGSAASPIGYKVTFKNDSDNTQTAFSGEASLALPRFPVALSGSLKMAGDDYMANGQMKYREKISKFSGEYRTTGSWSSQSKALNIFLSHPMLEAPLSLQSEFGQFDGATVAKVKFTHSNNRADDLKVEFSDDKNYKVTGLNSNTIYPRKINLLVTRPTADLHIQLQAEYGTSSTEMAAEVGATYMDRFKNNRTFKWTGNFVRGENKVTTTLELDSERLGLEGMVGFENGFHSILQTQRGLRPPLVHELNFDSKLPLAQMKMDYGPGRRLNFALGMPSDREASVSLSRTNYNSDTADALFMAKLNTSHVFHSKLNWRHDFWSSVFVRRYFIL
jgi:hypothetical protein